MADTISVSIIITFAAELLFSLALPILVLVIWKKKEGTELRPAWIGAAAYFVFGMVLEQLINAAVLGTGSSAVSAFLLGHPWLYAVYGGLSAGILEETARFLVYRTMLKDSVGRERCYVRYRLRRARVHHGAGPHGALYAHDVHLVQ